MTTTGLLVFQEAAGEGIPILLLGNKMDMDGDREVSFKDAEQLAHVSFIQSQWTVLFDYFTHNSNAKGFDLCVGKPGDVL